MNATAWELRGKALFKLGSLDKAGACFSKAIELRPQLASAHIGLGEVWMQLGQPVRALASFESALALSPGHVEVETKRGGALFCLSRFEEAAQCFGRVAQALPNQASTWNNWGSACREAGDLAAALDHTQRALQLAPDMVDAHRSLGNIYLDLLRIDEAVRSYRRCLELQPDNVEARLAIALCQLLEGDFRQGWQGYEQRWLRPQGAVRIPEISAPRWKGHEDLRGKTLLLVAEQGLGDTIQFCQFAPMLTSRGARIVLLVPRSLTALLASLDGVDQLITDEDEVPQVDFYCPLLSVPLALNIGTSDLPGLVQYLRAPPDRLSRWANLDHFNQIHRPRIGFVWAGNRAHRNDHKRSLPLNMLLDALPDGLDYFSLQKEPTPQELRLLAERGNVTHLGAEIEDFADTAALIQLMDMVVAVDTSVAHLGGALGKPTQVLVPFSPDWRWQLRRTDNPWYPSVTVHRQCAPGHWGSALTSLRHVLDSRRTALGER